MAERIVSPGVFTNEKDLSFLPAGIAAIGAVIIGTTSKGPAFVPTVVDSFNDFIAKFGGLSEETYVPYTVKSYLNSAATVTVVRVLTSGGYNAKSIQIIHSGSLGFKLVGTIMPTTAIGISTGKGFEKSTFTSSSASGSFGFTLSGSGVSAAPFTGSVNATLANSLTNVLGTSVKASTVGYLYTYFSDFLNTAYGYSGSIIFDTGSTTALVDYSGSTAGDFAPAKTPYITSQIIGASKLPLFRVISLSDGTDTNTAYKISIVNTTLPGDDAGSDYGSFTLAIRTYGDTDQRPEILESYTNLNLDPDSSNYILRRIGDKYSTVDATGTVVNYGDYRNVSKYIRCEVVDDVKNKAITANVKPFGFEALVQPISLSLIHI